MIFTEFPEPKPYCCPRCQGWYMEQDKRYGVVRCSAAHSPGSCCHYGEKELSEDERPQVSDKKGWTGLPIVTPDEGTWPLSVAAEVLDMEEQDLRDLVRIAGIDPVGTARMASFRRSGRQPRVYDANELIDIVDIIRRWRSDGT